MAWRTLPYIRPAGSGPAAACLAAVLAVALLAAGCAGPKMPKRHLLDRLWADYKQAYITADGRVLDPRLDRVTSEGQSYGLLRAVWSRDRETFGRVLAWTETNLARPDGLYAWLWKPIDGGRVADANTATDADQDIALALILAARAFDRPQYLERARSIIVAIRKHCALPVPGGWFISAGNWACAERIANLSYFSPLSYIYFQRLDPGGDWLGLIDKGYQLIDEVLNMPGVRLIPDFIGLTAEGKARLLPPQHGLSTVFSYDSMRIFWRVEMDCRVHKRVRACADPAGGQRAAELIREQGGLYPAYTPQGRPLETNHQSLTFYACLAPVLQRRAPGLYEEVMGGQMASERLLEVAREKNRYYDLNWAWFGLAGSIGLVEERTPPPQGLPK